MTYDGQKMKSGKSAVQIVELYMDRCTRTFGVAPCTATLPIGSTRKCFNTFATCRDRTNYAKTQTVYRFATTRIDGIQAPGDPPVFPTLSSVATAPTVLTPGKGLGIRSSVQVTIADHPWTDVFTDPYFTSDQDSVGTFWGKFVSRNKYYEWRRMDVLTGFLGDDGSYDPANFVRRTYLITRISGPGANGSVTIEAKDPLKRADNDKAQYPVLSRSTLSADITSSTTTITVAEDLGGDVFTALGGGALRPYLRIENEIVKVSSIVSLVPVVVNITRATLPSYYDNTENVAADHQAGVTIQPCVEWSNVKVYDIVYYLLNTVSGIDASYLPLAEWAADIENGYSYLSFSRLLCEPVGVKDLLSELTEHSVLLWWDERGQKVRMRALRFYQPLNPAFTDESSIIADTVSVTEDVGSLVTQSWLYFDYQWPLANKDLLRSYRTVYIRQQTDVESEFAYDRAQLYPIYSRWMPKAMAGVASSIGSLLLRQYSEVRKTISVDVDAKDDATKVGDVVGVSTRYVQDFTGLSTSRNYLVVQAEEIWTGVGVRMRYVLQEQFSFNRTGDISHPNGAGGDPVPAPADYGVASGDERRLWAYISNNDGKMPDGTSGYQIT